MGSFHCGGQRFRLLTKEAMDASLYDDSHDTVKKYSNDSIVFIDNSIHVIQPIMNEDAGIIDDMGKSLLFKSTK